ncbi:MAG: sigma-70 family RNA polymerase sigma factor [Planctomycetaceae bacterium]|nr:sigma-70 family RNA polymerase sigma factor [Planctomycetaceae bacterium]
MSAEFADPDIELMLRFQKGDERCFEELVKKHTRGVLNLVYRYLGDASRAEDVSQDIFVKVYRARMKYEPKAKFSTWLYRIAVNHCLNEIRSRKSQPSLGTPINDMIEEPEGENPDARLTRTELQGAVKAAIDALPENQRMAVILSRYEDMSYDEIAETMGMSLEAVKSVLFRAKENLKLALAKYAGGSS